MHLRPGDLVLNSDSEDGLLEDSSDEYMASKTQSDTESYSQLSVIEEPQRNTVVGGDGKSGHRGQGRAGVGVKEGLVSGVK